MAAAFDPYYKWLGIPPGEQPPNHYRLLGISLFESDHDVIEAAADQRMIHLRSFQTGQNAELSQKLLNEVAAAKLCLLRPERRASYDEALRRRLAPPAASRPPASVPPPLPPVGLPGAFAPAIPDFSAPEPMAAESQAPAPAAQAEWDGDPLDFSSGGPITARPAAVVPRSKSAMPIVIMIAAPILGLAVVAGAIKIFNDREEAAERQRESPQAAPTTSNVDRTDSSQPLPAMLVVDWPKEARTGGFLILDGVTFDLSQTTGALEYKLKPGEHKLGLRRPGMLPIDLTVPQQKEGDRYAFRPTWQIAAESPSATSVAAVDRPSRETPRPVEPPADASAEKTGTETSSAKNLNPQPPPATIRATVPSPAEPVRAAVPDEATQQKATAQMKDVLKDEFAQAKTSEAQLALARHLGQLAEEDFATDPAVSYVMAKEALELAIRQCEPALASDLVGGFTNHFNVDTWEFKATTLKSLAHNAKSTAVRESLAQGAIDLVEKALADERYKVAGDLATTASFLADVVKEVPLHDAAKEASERVRRLQRLAQEVEAASTTLAAHPDDPDANLTVGKSKCFLKDDWRFGLPMLLKGSDDALKDLARQDSAGPTDSADRLKLADAWWDLADKRAADKSDAARKDDWTIKPMRVRAAYWYQRALAGLSGLALIKAQKRIDEAEPARGESTALETAFLDDLPELPPNIGVGRLGKHGDAGYPGPRFKVRGAQPSHALSMQPPANGSSSVSYTLDHKWKSVTATAAIADDAKDMQGTLTFKVYGDGKQLWSSRPMRGVGQFQECSLRISNVQTLKLEVNCTGPNREAHAIWVNPVLAK